MINQVTLIGYIGNDVEVKIINDQTRVATLRLATNENYKDSLGEWKTKTEWHNIVLWRHLAERVAQSYSKGDLIYVVGSLATRKFQNKEGEDQYTTEVVAKNIRLLSKKIVYSSGSSTPADI